jgi:regulator of nonsense transcripts 1
MDVGEDYLTLGVGASWPAGVMEMRKHDNYIVRLDKTISSVPLRAQRLSLEKLRKGRAGYAANSLVQLFYDTSSKNLNAAREMPGHFEDPGSTDSFDERVRTALSDAISHMSFKPNESQQTAVAWALKRKTAMIRGPPGTGKTRVAALLISTAIKMELNQLASKTEEKPDQCIKQTPRILAVTHSNGAADVLVQALLDMNVPAVRGGRPASVSPSIQHRTIAALAERLPEVVKLRQQASDPSLDTSIRQAAIYDSKKSLNDAIESISRTAPVIVTSCIGAQQLLSSMAVQDNQKDGSTFPIVVLDEAGQTTEPALICALTSAQARQVILVGDTQQLPPTVTTEDAELRKTIGVSPMERLLKNGIEEFILQEQYRMPESLLKHPNTYFYNGAVKVAVNGGVDSNLPAPKGFPWPSKEPLAFLDVGNDSEVTHSFSGRSNPTEVEVIIEIIENILLGGEIEANNIAIITPYNKQVQLFRTKLNNGSLVRASKMTEVQVGTVDSFQGQETDLVLFSSVRSNLLREMGFLRDARRLNVAITRAKRGLIVVGDSKVLRTCKHWSALLDSCSSRGCILSHWEYKTRSNKFTSDNEGSSINVEVNKDDKFFGLFADGDDEDDELFGLFSA